MVDEEIPKDQGKPPRRRRRQPTTLDLSATEVSVERPAGSSESAAPRSALPPPAPPPNSAREEYRAAPPPDEPAEAPRTRLPFDLPFQFPWPLAGAAAAGAAAILLVVGLLSLFGVIQRRDAGVTDLASRLARIETQLGSRGDEHIADPKALDDVSARLAKVEAAQATPRAPLTDTALANRLAAIEASTKSLGDVLSSINQRGEDMAAGLRDARERNEASAAAIKELQAAERQRPSADKGETDRLANRIAALERSTRSVEEKLGTPASDRTMRLALLASALKDVVERGVAFNAELAAVKPLVGDANQLAALEPFAARGLPTPATLGAELSALVPAMAHAVDGTQRDGSLLDRLQQNASRLVRIRPIDEPRGDDPADVLTRIESKAARSDISGALAELDKLPPLTRAPADAWIARAQARNAAVAAARNLAADALNALGKAS